MALINCKECGGKVSDKATICPHCGCPLSVFTLVDNQSVSDSRDNKECNQVQETQQISSQNQNLEKPSMKSKKKKLWWFLVALFIIGIVAIFFGTKFFPFEDESSYNVIKTMAKYVGKYNTLYPFHEGLAIVGVNDTYGYINTKGEEVIPCKYDYADDFHEGLARVKDDNKYGFIDINGEKVIPCKYDYATDFNDGRSTVVFIDEWGNRKYSFINKQGRVITPYFYDYVWDIDEDIALRAFVSFSEGFGVVVKDGKWGYIDQFGLSTFDY